MSCTWSDADVKSADKHLGQMKGARRTGWCSQKQNNFCWYTKKKLAKQGYDRDWQQCRSKIINLKGDYRKVKDDNGETGRRRKTCTDESDMVVQSELDSTLLPQADTEATCSVEPKG